LLIFVHLSKFSVRASDDKMLLLRRAQNFNPILLVRSHFFLQTQNIYKSTVKNEAKGVT